MVLINSSEPTAGDVSDCFNLSIGASERTILKGGASEPYYKPGSPHVIFFRDDYIRSALHEVAHWCVAGTARRALSDYGYWYAPDGRNEAQQMAFYGVEVKPQAIEKAFCRALCIEFTVSVDNLSVSPSDPAIGSFEAAVDLEFERIASTGLPPRAEVFRKALAEYRQFQDWRIQRLGKED